MAFAPDGRIFVSEQTGELRVVKNGVLLAQAFVSLTVDSSGERGLLGVAFDPTFATNHFVYVYYTVPTTPAHNRVSRFTANGDVAVAGSEHPILDLDNLSAAPPTTTAARCTSAGRQALHRRRRERQRRELADPHEPARQDAAHQHRRHDPDRQPVLQHRDRAPTARSGRWACATRSRSRSSRHRRGSSSTTSARTPGRRSTTASPGANYGWPNAEGVRNDLRYRDPLYAYAHGTTATTGCAITGGAFYNPTTVKFPSSYVGDYFFVDYCMGWINRYDPVSDSVSTFATTGFSPIDLADPGDGNLYYLVRGGSIFTIGYTGSGAPSIGTQPQSQTVSVGGTATFSVVASGLQPLSYQWLRGGVAIPGATSASYSLPNVTMNDNQVGFRVRVTNSAGSALSNAGVLTVTSDQPPAAQITQPAAGNLYSAGQTINYAGTATDPEQGVLPGSAFTWQIDLHHADHIHPAMPPTSGAKSGSFVVPTTGHTDSNVFYRFLLTVRDAQGLTTTVFRDVQPRKADLSFATTPAGLTLDLDAQPQPAPFTVTGVVGIHRDVEAPSPQVFNGKTYDFVAWSSNRARVHTITTPSVNTTYTATYRQVTRSGGLSARYYNNKDLTGKLVNRVDGSLDFDWGTNSPAAGIDPDTFSARWTGTVAVPTTGSYTFYTLSDDGVRLWVNDHLLVTNWSTHAVTENSGTISLTAGTRYALRMEYFEDVGPAVARLLWSGPSIPKSAVPSSALSPKLTAMVNFQPAGAMVPTGYLADTGATIGLRDNGERYGWNTNISAHMLDRNSARSPDQRYDTLAEMQTAAAPNAFWEMVVPNGTYTVRIVAGDPSAIDSNYRINVEGVSVVSGSPTLTSHWVDATATVTVNDNRLSVTSAAGAVKNKICFIEIS